jgi:hypothetical protein
VGRTRRATIRVQPGGGDPGNDRQWDRPSAPTRRFYSQSEVQALREKREESADDVRTLLTLVHALRTVIVNTWLVKGGASSRLVASSLGALTGLAEQLEGGAEEIVELVPGMVGCGAESVSARGVGGRLTPRSGRSSRGRCSRRDCGSQQQRKRRRPSGKGVSIGATQHPGLATSPEIMSARAFHSPSKKPGRACD